MPCSFQAQGAAYPVSPTTCGLTTDPAAANCSSHNKIHALERQLGSQSPRPTRAYSQSFLMASATASADTGSACTRCVARSTVGFLAVRRTSALKHAKLKPPSVVSIVFGHFRVRPRRRPRPWHRQASLHRVFEGLVTVELRPPGLSLEPFKRLAPLSPILQRWRLEAPPA